MTLSRTRLLERTGLALAAAGLGETLFASGVEARAADAAPAPSWAALRRGFRLVPDRVHLGGNLLASHPAAVRAAIDRHRASLDRNPVEYLHANQARLEAEVVRAAAAYLGADPTEIALTDSTTMGLGLLYAGLDVRRGQEILTTTHDFFATHEAVRWKAERAGARVRQVALYDRGAAAAEKEIVRRLIAAVTPETRVVALTWVHSSTGVKLQISEIAAALRRLRNRPLLCVDAVHALGVEAFDVTSLGCDFLVAGCHKWLFGPRGTGIVWGRPEAWASVAATIPSFGGGAAGAAHTPGGFHSFEHRWALAEAFRLHLRLGKARVAARIHDLNSRFKSGLARIPNVTLHTPRSPSLSAGMVCFEVRELAPGDVVERLAARRIVATVTPYATQYARVAPGLLNTPAELERALDAIRAL